MGEILVFGAMNVGYAHAQEIKDIFVEAGSEAVQEDIRDVPLGAKNPNLEMTRKSVDAYKLGAKGIVAAIKHIPCCT